MNAKIQKWGNSQGIRIPKVMLDMVQLKENDDIKIQLLNGNLVIAPIKKHKSLEERIFEYNDDYICEMKYTPNQGDIISLDLNLSHDNDDHTNKELALVVSNNTYNNFTKLAIVCPIVYTKEVYPLHVMLGDELKTEGSVICEEVKALDIEANQISFCEKVSTDILEEVIDILKGFIEGAE